MSSRFLVYMYYIDVYSEKDCIRKSIIMQECRFPAQ